MVLKFIRYNKDAKLPKRKYSSDTGADIYMMKEDWILPGETKVIPTGFGIEVPNGYTAKLQVRTSIAKRGILVEGCAIDAGYTGEIHIIMHNIGNYQFHWKVNDRLCYIEVYPVQYPEFVEEDVEQRGKGAFGSTGR